MYVLVGVLVQVKELYRLEKRAGDRHCPYGALKPVRREELRDRIKSALRNCGFEFPHGQGVTINLAPADVRKEGSGFDLPMALGLVGCQGQFFGKQLDKMMFLGELSLDGSVRSVRFRRRWRRGSSD